MKTPVQLFFWIAAFEAVSTMIGLATQPQVDGWYAALHRPWFTPPNLVFPVMWTILYAMIAAAGFYIWRARGQDAAGNRRVWVFVLYMALNWSWSFVFFTQQQLFAGLVWIVGMNVLAVMLVVMCWKPLRNAAVLMLPPLGWTLFAAVLNGAFWWLNRGA